MVSYEQVCQKYQDFIENKEGLDYSAIKEEIDYLILELNQDKEKTTNLRNMKKNLSDLEKTEPERIFTKKEIFAH